MKNKVLGFIALGAIVFGFFWCFMPEGKDENVLIMGTNSGFVPYEYVNEDGTIVGFDVDIATEIAKRLGKKLITKDMNFDALIMALQQKKIDVIIAGMSITQERLKKIDMIHYYGKTLTQFPILFWGKIPNGVKNVYDIAKLTNKKVAAQAGTTHEKFISKFDFLDIVHFNKISELIMEIKYGKSIACIIEPLVVDALIVEHPQIKVLNIPAGSDYADHGNGIGISKSNKKLSRDISKIINDLKQEGSKIATKWFKGGRNGVS